MHHRMDNPPDGQPPTCVGAPEAGRILHIALGPNDLLVVAESEHPSGTSSPPLRLLEQIDQKCEMKDCDHRGVKFYDRTWCCDSCGEALVARICQELDDPMPRNHYKVSRPQRRKRK